MALVELFGLEETVFIGKRMTDLVFGIVPDHDLFAFVGNAILSAEENEFTKTLVWGDLWFCFAFLSEGKRAPHCYDQWGGARAGQKREPKADIGVNAILILLLMEFFS